MTSHLSIDLSPHGARMIVLRDGVALHSVDVSFEDASEDAHKETLKKAFADHPFLSDDFDEVTLGWASRQSTLVPNSVFADSDPKSIYKLCYGEGTPSGEVDYNRISELSVVNTFQIPLWIKSFFVIRFPRVVLQHSGSHLLRHAINTNAFRSKVSAVVYTDHFLMSIVKHNELQFYSSFDAGTPEDVIYHLMFVLQQKELADETGSIEITSGCGANPEICKEVVSGLSKIGNLKSYKVSFVEGLVPQSHTLCV